MRDPLQRWEAFPKVFGVRVKAHLLGPFPARTYPSLVVQGDALAWLKQTLGRSGLFLYGAFGARIYFGNPRLEWEAALAKFALWWLFAEIVETPSGVLTEQSAFVSGWSLAHDKPLLTDPLPFGGSERLHGAILRTQFLPWREYLHSAPLHGLTVVPRNLVSKDSGKPIIRADSEED